MASVLEQGEVYHIFSSVVHNLGLKELGEVEDEAEDNNRNNIDDDTLIDGAGLGDIAVGIRVTHRTIPEINR